MPLHKCAISEAARAARMRKRTEPNEKFAFDTFVLHVVAAHLCVAKIVSVRRAYSFVPVENSLKASCKTKVENTTGCSVRHDAYCAITTLIIAHPDHRGHFQWQPRFKHFSSYYFCKQLRDNAANKKVTRISALHSTMGRISLPGELFFIKQKVYVTKYFVRTNHIRSVKYNWCVCVSFKEIAHARSPSVWRDG